MIGDICRSAVNGGIIGNAAGQGKIINSAIRTPRERLSYTLSVSQTYDEDNREDRRINLYFSIPFSWGDGITEKRRDLFVSNSTTFDKDGYRSNNTSLSGVAGVAISSATGLT